MAKQLAPEIESSKEYEGSKLQENPKSWFMLVAAKLVSGVSPSEESVQTFIQQHTLLPLEYCNRKAACISQLVTDHGLEAKTAHVQ